MYDRYEELEQLEAGRERVLTPPPEPTAPSFGSERHDNMHLTLALLLSNQLRALEDERAQKFVETRDEMISTMGASRVL